MTISVSFIDHVAITATSLDDATRFYQDVLGAEIINEFIIDGELIGRQLRIGRAMVNVHQAGHGHALVAGRPTPGSVDLCFRWDAPIQSAIDRLVIHDVAIIDGPSRRLASDGKEGLSVYFRDPDGNLLEFLSTFPA